MLRLQSFFNPKSIAVVGASEKKNKVGYLVVKNLLQQGYKGKIYLVNKHKGKIFNKNFINYLPDVEMVVFAIPADGIFEYLEEMGKKNIKNAVIFSAGFKEMGEMGKQKEDRLRLLAKENNISLLGPNCIGYINTNRAVNLTFLKTTAPKGNIGFISQSGALGSALLDYFSAHKNLGFSYFVSLGNKTIIDESDTLEFLINDKHTKVIALYLESVKNTRKFKSILKRATEKKPVIILKSGRTEKGLKAALSHTGSIVGDDNMYDALFSQFRAIRADNYIEFLTLLKIFSYNRVPISDSVLILSNAGGPGVLLTDDLVEKHIPLKHISEELKEQIKRSMPGRGEKISIHNPIDLLGDASSFDYEAVIKETSRDKNIGSTIILLTPQANTEIKETANVITELQRHFREPLFPVFMGEQSVKNINSLFEENYIVHFSEYTNLVNALAKISVWRKARNSQIKSSKLIPSPQLDQVKEVILNRSKDRSLDLITVFDVFQKIDLPVADYKIINNDAIEQSKNFEFPLVIKASSSQIVHKTEQGAVITNICSEKEMKNSMNKLSKLRPQNIIVQKMIKGVELFIGAKRIDDEIVLTLGLGGILVELLKKISYGVYPLSQFAFHMMLNKVDLDKLTNGFRGIKVDENRLLKILNSIGDLVYFNDKVTSIDINPLIISKYGLFIVDGRIVLD